MDSLTAEEIREIQLQFCEESSERLDLCENLILNLGRKIETSQLTDLKRILHGLKGSSAAVGFKSFGNLAHKLESELAVCKFTKTEVDRLLLQIDQLRKLLIVDGE